MSDSYQVSFENDYVRIVNVTIPAGQEPTEYTPASLPLIRIDLDSRKTRYVDSSSRLELARPSEKAVREIRVELKAAPRESSHSRRGPHRSGALQGRF